MSPDPDAVRILLEVEPEFDPAQHRVDKVETSADGRFRRVTFKRIAGNAKKITLKLDKLQTA
jgi:hypothetical protein